MLLAIITLLYQIKIDFCDTILNIPIKVTTVVHIGQFLTLLLAIMSQTDILVALRTLICLSIKKDEWLKLTEQNERRPIVWLRCIFLPNLLKALQGLVS